MNIKTEIKTLDTSATLFNFLQALDFADNAEITRFNETEKALGLLKLLRGQFTTLQHGNSTGAANVGELPNCIYKPVIQSLYDTKKINAELENRGFNLNFEGYRDNQVRQLKYYIETGELFNRKKETLQERAMVAIDKLEGKLKAEQAKLAKAVKAKADADAAKAKADADAVIIEVSNLIDSNPIHADAVKNELAGIVDAVKADVVKADAVKADAVKIADKAQTTKDKADADVDKTKKELDKVKAKLASLSAPKAENNKNEPKLDFKILNFSKDCKDTAASILEELEREATSAPELLYLAKLILDKYNK
jgi:hypothetical protein